MLAIASAYQTRERTFGTIFTILRTRKKKAIVSTGFITLFQNKKIIFNDSLNIKENYLPLNIISCFF